MERDPEALERGLTQVVVVLAGQTAEVHRHPSMEAEAPKELRDVLGRHLAEPIARERQVPVESTPPGHIDRDEDEGLVHRGVIGGVALDRLALLERSRDCLTKHDADIFDRVVIVDLEVALRANAEIEAPMESHQLQHMIEELDAGVDVLARPTVEIENDVDAGFSRISVHFRVSNPGGAFTHAEVIPSRVRALWYTISAVSRLAARFQSLRGRGEGALIPFVVAGDPSLDELPSILDALCDGGADVIEVGIPFSDPIADGPTIQAASQRALDRGVQPPAVLEALAAWSRRAGENRPPVVLMGYYNPILRQGLKSFAKASASSGADGTIVSDLTPEESTDWVAASREAGLDNIFLAAPTSTDARLDIVCERASGFVYAVSRTGVTGFASAVPEEVRGLAGRIHARTDVPVAVGFGIRTPDHVRMVCDVAEGAVVGSALVELLAADWQSGSGRAKVSDWVRALKDATRANPR